MGTNVVYNTKFETNWKSIRTSEFENKIFWARIHFNLDNKPIQFKPLGVGISTFGAYEAYWDGVLIGTNGRVGNETARQGQMTRTFLLPDSLTTQGQHTLELRMSQYYYSKDKRHPDAIVTGFTELIEYNYTRTIFANILAGGVLIIGFYFLILFFNNKSTVSFLLFGISSLLFFLLIVVEYAVFYFPIHYSWHYCRLEIISILTLLISFLIPLYFSIQFAIPKQKIFSIAYLIVLIFIYVINHKYGSYDETTALLTLSMWISSEVMAGYAIIKKKQGAIIVFIGLSINVILNYFVNQQAYDQTLGISFAVLLICMFYILFIREKERQKSYEYSLIQTTVLKHELLKKKIQPHFLMNTLTSLVDWVEESPAVGVRFIEALANEFDLLNQVENSSKITILQEIELCKSYIDIMKYRKEISYIWEDVNIDEHEEIPPAVIHTLLENSITHCSPSANGTMKFKLIFDCHKNSKTYTFLTYATLRNANKPIVEGTGTKYIKARLEESYNKNWRFDSQPTNEGWLNTITIYN